MTIWYSGSQGGTAIANLLFGRVLPGGKLPYTWLRSVGQIPIPYAHLVSKDSRTTAERYWNKPGMPAYPFGFGLGYSTFSFSNLRIGGTSVVPGESVPVTVDLRNTGTRRADDVAQLYIHQRHGTSARPVRELKGFKRVTLKSRPDADHPLHAKAGGPDLLSVFHQTLRSG